MSEPKGFSFFVAVCFTVNYIMGTGFLTLPWAFERSGVILGIIALFFLGFLGNISKDLVLETMARVQFLEEHGGIAHKPEGLRRRWSSLILMLDDPNHNQQNLHGSTDSINRIEDPLLSNQQHGTKVDDTLPPPPLLVKEKKYEFPELCEIFLGTKGKRFYMVSICLYLYGSLWAYSSVFASSLKAHAHLPFLDNEHQDYLFYLGIFLFTACPMTCLEVKEQVVVQVFLASCRILMVFVMVATVIGAFGSDNDCFGLDYPQDTSSTPFFAIQKIYLILPIAVYAYIFHHSLPTLSESVADKTKLSKIFAATILICAISYTFVGSVISFYFGSSTESSVNINWTHYNGCASGETPFWADIISYFIVIFPAADVFSAFPLNGITLGNSLMSAYFGDEVHDVENNRKVVSLFRLLAAIPPLVGAFFVSDLSKITDFCGVFGIIITFIFPALLSIKSNERVNSSYYQAYLIKSQYSNIFTSEIVSKFMIGFGIICSVFVFISLIVSDAT